MASRSAVRVLVAIMLAGMFGRAVAGYEHDGTFGRRRTEGPHEFTAPTTFECVLFATGVAVFLTVVITENIRTVLATTVNYAWVCVIIMLLRTHDMASQKTLPMCPA